MSFTKRTYFKALFLAIVFSLNTVVSFACSFSPLFHGMHHHKADVATDKHSGNPHSQGETAEHHHGSKAEHQHDDHSSKDSKDDDCCSEFVVEIEKAEKAVSKTIEAPNAIFATSFLSSYSQLFLLSTTGDTSFPHYVRWRLPATIQDLRIVIQSFQI
jgi:hypothetical protein